MTEFDTETALARQSKNIGIDSRTSVTYSVTVQINVEDEEDSLSANESVTVVFGMTEEEIKQLQQRQSMQGGQTQS